MQFFTSTDCSTGPIRSEAANPTATNPVARVSGWDFYHGEPHTECLDIGGGHALYGHYVDMSAGRLIGIPLSHFRLLWHGLSVHGRHRRPDVQRRCQPTRHGHDLRSWHVHRLSVEQGPLRATRPRPPHLNSDTGTVQ